MNEIFEEIISKFMESRVGQVDHFLSETLSSQLKENLLLLLSEKKLKEAGIGNKEKLVTNKSIRSDVIYWLSREHDDIHEIAFFDLMDAFVEYLNMTCYTGITGYEFHYAYYDAGSYYKRHLDQFKDNHDRAYSMIMYLNEGWVLADGGQLQVYHEQKTQTISPLNGTCVFFKSSELEHEVLLSNKARLSITGWLKTN